MKSTPYELYDETNGAVNARNLFDEYKKECLCSLEQIKDKDFFPEFHVPANEFLSPTLFFNESAENHELNFSDAPTRAFCD